MLNSCKFVVIAILSAACVIKPSSCSAADAPKSPPNILLIVADDMGYSDLGCFGSEISTPNIDALAARGMRATNFCAAPTCSPSRSMLLTGNDNHQVGFGSMAEWIGPSQRGKPGYEGHLNGRTQSIASRLRSRGYHTYMAAKWHLGEHPENWPARNGFTRDFSLLQGAGSHWSDMLGLLPSEPKVTFTRNGQKVESLPPDYYSSKNFTDAIIQNIDENADDGKPFFAYLGFQAPHGPLAVPDGWRDRCKGRYDKGYDAIRESRLERQKKLGITGQQVTICPRLPTIPAWNDLTTQQKQEAARKMELYAAMIEYMDDQIGRLVTHLKNTGKYENTLIIFISDNGAAGEDMANLISQLSPQAKQWFEKTFDNRIENWGRPGSCIEYGPAWAQVSSVPLRLFKGVVAEGGIRVPLVISGPGVQHAGTINHSLMHVMDITPTLLESAAVEPPEKRTNEPEIPPQGKSMWPVLANRAQSTRSSSDWIGWELFGNRAVRQGDWKLLYLLKGAGGTGEWQLFNLKDDPAEQHDVSSRFPEKRDEMLKLWNQYISENGVIMSEAGPFSKPNP